MNFYNAWGHQYEQDSKRNINANTVDSAFSHNYNKGSPLIADKGKSSLENIFL